MLRRSIVKLIHFNTEPSMPTSLTNDSATYTTMTLSWMEPDMPNGIIMDYHLQYRRANSGSRYYVLFPINDQLTRMVTGLSPSTEYEFRVAATTVVGRGNYTSVITATTLSEFYYNYVDYFVHAFILVV